MSETQGSHRRGRPLPGAYEPTLPDWPAAADATGEPEPAVPAPRGADHPPSRRRARGPAAAAPPETAATLPDPAGPG
ncbi:hypothetical protein ACFV9H_23005, partial [Streptomyces sp. NPDC059874]